MTLQVKNSLNASAFPKKYEVNTLPSMTIPDQALTINEIMVRYARGLPIGGQRIPIFDGEDDDLPDPRTLDLSERQDYAEIVTQELQSLQNNYQNGYKKTNQEKSVKVDSNNNVGNMELPSGE